MKGKIRFIFYVLMPLICILLAIIGLFYKDVYSLLFSIFLINLFDIKIYLA